VGSFPNSDQAEQQVLGIDAAMAEPPGLLTGHEDSGGGVVAEPGQHPAVDRQAGAATGTPGRTGPRVLQKSAHQTRAGRCRGVTVGEGQQHRSFGQGRLGGLRV